jgi:hypothetical protein
MVVLPTHQHFAMLALLAPPLCTPLPAQETPDSAVRARVEWFIHAPSLWFGTTRGLLIAKLGQPKGRSASANAQPNPYDTLTTDTLVTLRYNGATFAFYVVPNIHGEYLFRVTVEAPRYLKQSPIRLGATVSEVRTYFGDTSTGPTASATYSCYWCDALEAGPTVTFWFAQGRVRGIKWEWPVD